MLKSTFYSTEPNYAASLILMLCSPIHLPLCPTQNLTQRVNACYF